MGNWGEDFLEKTFNINYDEMRALLLYQYLVETKEKANASNTKDKNVSDTSYANELYRDLSATIDKNLDAYWDYYFKNVLKNLEKYDVGKDFEGESVFDTRLFTKNLSRYYENLLFITCLFELNRCSESKIPPLADFFQRRITSCI